MTKTATYHSANSAPSEAWLAYAYLPSGQRWNVFATAATEADAVRKITSLIESELAKYHHPAQTKFSNPFIERESEAEFDKPVQTAKTGRGAHFAGKAWLINTKTREKIRVPKEEVDKYLTSGWERGGPRSK